MDQIKIQILIRFRGLLAVFDGNDNTWPLQRSEPGRRTQVLTDLIVLFLPRPALDVLQFRLQRILVLLALLQPGRKILNPLIGYRSLDILCAAELHRQHEAQNHTDAGYRQPAPFEMHHLQPS